MLLLLYFVPILHSFHHHHTPLIVTYANDDGVSTLMSASLSLSLSFSLVRLEYIPLCVHLYYLYRIPSLFGLGSGKIRFNILLLLFFLYFNWQNAQRHQAEERTKKHKLHVDCEIPLPIYASRCCLTSIENNI